MRASGEHDNLKVVADPLDSCRGDGASFDDM